MKLRHLSVVLITLVLTTACGTQTSPVVEPEVPIMQETDELEKQTSPPTETVEPEVLISQETDELENQTLPPTETAAPDCPGDEISPIGESIADDYEVASYEQVMTWFCDGAEFEDILVALETEMQTETPADEMLQMLADGFTWEEIWQLVGLTD